MKYHRRFGLALAFFFIFQNWLLAFPHLQSDTLKVLAIRVEFQADENPATTGDGRFDMSTSSDPFQVDPPPHNRSYFQDHLIFAKNYFQKVSQGQLIVQGKVFPREQNSAYQLDHPMEFYNPNTTPQEINQGLARLLQEAVQKADADPDIQFSRYDAVVVFHAGVGRDIDLGLDNTPQDIPSLFITSTFLQNNLGIDGIVVDDGETVIRNGILLPETESQEGLQLGLNGMLVSNLGSFLGWPDLFSPDTRRSGVGRFGVMDAGLFNGDGLLPAIPTAWTRIIAGWESPQTIFQAQGDEFTVYHPLSNQGPHVYKIPINRREYFLVENRYSGKKSLDSLQFVMSDQRGELVGMREVLETHLSDQVQFSDSTGVLLDIDNPDRGLPGGGILIWHIDETVIEANRSTNRINADPNHRGVDLEEADGSQDIGAEFDFLSGGSGSEIGTALDPWYADNTAPLFQAEPANEFSLNSIPNSRSYYNRANSHIRLFDFSHRDSVMSFKAEINFFQQHFPRHISPEEYGKITALKTTDVDDDGAMELIATSDKNDVLLINTDGISDWGTDSLRIFRLPESFHVNPPPALFPMADGSQGIVILTREGLASGYRFNSATHTVDSLFQFQLSSEITTHPIFVEFREGGGIVHSLFWGGQNGAVYRLNLDASPLTFEERFTIPEPIAHLHFLQENNSTRIVAITSSGTVYLDGQSLQSVPGLTFPPVGKYAVAPTSEGRLIGLLDNQFEHPETGIFRFDSPLIAIPEISSPTTNRELFIIAGDNRVLVYHHNFTLYPEFPKPFYTPAQSTELFLSPVVGFFPGNANTDEVGIIVADPAGLLTGYDLSGGLLPDFPLAVGDSIATAPALLDIDGDGDLELATVTISGDLYLWDFASRVDASQPLLWNQQYADAGNLNQLSEGIALRVRETEALLPEQLVYNWPNPNTDNFTFIRYRLSNPAEVTIKIYDLAGDLVKELTGTGFGGTDNEVRWDLTNVQSGVYFARIEAKGNSKSEVRIIKIAVVK